MESERVDGPRNSEGTYNNAQALMGRGELELLRVQTHKRSIRDISKIRQMGLVIRFVESCGQYKQ